MKRSEIRQHIIQTAADLFYANGYNATGINEIIAEAGIAKATLYHHFKSKEDICIAYLKYKNDFFLKTIKNFIATKPKGKVQLLGIFDFLKEFYKEPNFSGCWCIRTIAEIPTDNITIRKEIQCQKNELIRFLNQVVSHNVPNISNNAGKKLAKSLYLLYESAVSESHLHGNDWPIHAAKNIGKQLIT
ncbi:MAG: TetR/AcrR family transcriptional regulator [Bacteroidota bacterium]